MLRATPHLSVTFLMLMAMGSASVSTDDTTGERMSTESTGSVRNAADSDQVTEVPKNEPIGITKVIGGAVNVSTDSILDGATGVTPKSVADGSTTKASATSKLGVINGALTKVTSDIYPEKSDRTSATNQVSGSAILGTSRSPDESTENILDVLKFVYDVPKADPGTFSYLEGVPRPRALDIMPNICDDVPLDSIDLSPDGRIHAFQGNRVIQISEDKVESILPVNQVFSGGPETVDAVVTIDTKLGPYTLLFKDTVLWAYYWNGETFVLEGNPQTINSQLGITGPVDAAFTLDQMDTFYLKQGDNVWKMNLSKTGHLRVFGPQMFTGYTELQNLQPFMAAFTSANGNSYFLDKDVQYVMERNSNEISETTFNMKGMLNCTTLNQ